MNLYVFPPSPHSKKVLMAQAELGLAATQHIVDLRSGAQRSPEMLALNPNGLMPVVEFAPGDALWESNAIINRMALGTDLLPAPALPDVMRWQFWEASHWAPVCQKYISANLFGREGINLDAAGEEFANFAQVLDTHLEGRAWICGDQLTTADITVAAMLSYRDICKMPYEGFAQLTRWIEALTSRASWAAAHPERQEAA